MKRTAIWAISIYQQAVSPYLPSACRFAPTCSHYFRDALIRYGVVKGGFMGLWRLVRCNPWGGKGYDPVP